MFEDVGGVAQPRPSKGDAPLPSEEPPAGISGHGHEYAYRDKTKSPVSVELLRTEANHAVLNPAYYPKSQKPEALWGEAEKNGAESPRKHPAQ